MHLLSWAKKEDILIKHLEDEEKKIVSEFSNRPVSSIRDIIYYVSYFIQENSKVIKAIYAAGLTHKLTDMLNERIYSYFPVSHQSIEGELATKFYVGAILAVYSYWIDTGMKEPAETVAEIICNLVAQDNAIEYLVYPS
jgi:hypothetical protein